MTEITFGGIVVGASHPPLVVPEMGINHGGNLDVAKKLVESAANAGAKIIKNQTHIPDAEMSLEAKLVRPGNASKSIYDVIRENSLSLSDEERLFEFTKSCGLEYLSTPFSREAAFFLNDLGVSAFKIGSGECNNYPLVELVADFGKPVILSTGMNSISSIKKSVEIFRKNGVRFALLHTTNLYPTKASLVRLGAMVELKENFPDSVIGLSDHTQSNGACVASVALGAKILERHFTDSMDRTGPDISCSMDEVELKALLKMASDAHESLGGHKGMMAEEKVTANFAFASVVSTREIEEGEILTLENVWVKRPAGGDFSAEDLPIVLGSRAGSAIPANVQIRAKDISS